MLFSFVPLKEMVKMAYTASSVKTLVFDRYNSGKEATNANRDILKCVIEAISMSCDSTITSSESESVF